MFVCVLRLLLGSWPRVFFVNRVLGVSRSCDSHVISMVSCVIVM